MTVANFPKKYWHTVLQLTRRLPGSGTLADSSPFPSDQFLMIDACRPGLPLPYHTSDVFSRVVLSATASLICGLNGTSVTLSTSGNYLKPLRSGGFAFSILDFTARRLGVTESIPVEVPSFTEEVLHVFEERCSDVYKTSQVIRAGTLPLNAVEALAMGTHIGAMLRDKSSVEETMRLSSLLVNSISRGGVPSARLTQSHKVSPKGEMEEDLPDLVEEVEVSSGHE
jgi:hypothetical protein